MAESPAPSIHILPNGVGLLASQMEALHIQARVTRTMLQIQPQMPDPEPSWISFGSSLCGQRWPTPCTSLRRWHPVHWTIKMASRRIIMETQGARARCFRCSGSSLTHNCKLHAQAWLSIGIACFASASMVAISGSTTNYFSKRGTPVSQRQLIILRMLLGIHGVHAIGAGLLHFVVFITFILESAWLACEEADGSLASGSLK